MNSKIREFDFWCHEQVFQNEKPRLRMFFKVRNNTPLKRGFKRLSGLYAPLWIRELVVSFFLCHEQVIYNQIPIYFWPKQILSPIYNKSTHRKIYCKLFVLSCKVESQVLVTFLNIQVVKIWFPAQNRRSGLYFDFNKEKNWVSHYKTLAQLTQRDSKTEKDSS